MTVCPDREQLVQFLDGRVAPPVAEAVSRHVDGCTACLAALETLTDDSQFRPAGGIRRADTGPSPAFLDRLKAASPGAAAARPVRPPTIPGYEIEEELGRGGAGVVYKARHAALDRTVALKVMLGGGHVGADELARFRAEALAVGRLAHSGIVRVYEVGEWTPAGGGPPLPYASLEYVSGGSWDRELGRTPQPPRAAAERLAGLAAAAHAAHREGIIHRDIKPANVLIDAATGAAKIADFGLAKQLRLDSGRTQTGVILGTPSYMSPEQARGDRAVDARTDVYGLGAVLYEVLTGRPPFLGPTPLDTIVQVAEVDPIAPRQLQPTIPRDLETICLKCLEKAPARRYPSAAALADDLDRFLAGRPIIAHPVGPVGRAVKLARRHPVVVSLAAALVVVIVGSLAGLTTLYAQAVRDRADADSARQKAQDEAAAAGAERAKALAAKEEAEAATGRAKKAAAGVQAVSGFFQKNVLAAPRPKGTGAGIDVTLRQAIDDAEGKIRDQFRDQPEIEAAVRDTLVSTYYLRGQYDKAAAQAERVLALRRGFLTPDDPEVFSAQNNLALSYLQLGRFPEAETMLRDTLAGRERVLGPDAPQTLASMNSLAGYLLFSGQSR
ncbi:MAG TPA: serine/threonine-protein kinase, partial [Urbifossiella sp.]|nr:serine/threonine-protein kinase [Urbifossiella sp.]